jgi:hypothetical protein
VAGASSTCSSLLRIAQVLALDLPERPGLECGHPFTLRWPWALTMAAMPVGPGLADRRARVGHTSDRCGIEPVEMFDVVICTDENLAA